MDLSNLVAVSGLSGIFKMAKNRKNGLILENIDTEKKKFYSSRKHQFTPLESISIYTYGDTVELHEVFAKMRDQFETNPPVAHKSDNDTLRDYFETILPSFDREKVFISDIKRLIKWFNFLMERNLLEDKPEEENAEAEETAEKETTDEAAASEEETTED